MSTVRRWLRTTSSIGFSISASFFVLTFIPSVAYAQSSETWVRAEADSLVLRAIERRGLQLADSTLLSYEAKAHGFLAFLAQLGEGKVIPPRIVQSEELMSRLYWWQPNRSVQRLVGRRDTTLLPAAVGYYRDRYQVVLDNLPDQIRLGDGQDVRDVPHPLSPNASSQYEYARSGRVSISLPGRQIVVDEIRFRPIDDSRPGAVGSVFLDRDNAAVVRLSMAFTRSAIIDKRIETLVLTLENVLVNTRYWLPRLQEVEVSRRSTWFEIPARGIVRGRWEISEYVVNERFPDSTTRLPRFSAAPSDSLRAFPFEKRIVDVLPQDIQMASDDELKAARAQVEAAVRAAALARPSRSALSGRGISDFARYSRLEGLAVGAGMSRRVGDALLSTRVSYGTSDKELKAHVAVGLMSGLGGNMRTHVFVEREYRDVTEQERSGITNSMAALLFGSDYTLQTDTRSAGVVLRNGVSPWQLRLAWEDDRPAAVVSKPLSGAFEPALSTWLLEGVRGELKGSGGWFPQHANALRGDWSAKAELGYFKGIDLNENRVKPALLRLHGAVELTKKFAGDRQLFSRTFSSLVTGNDIPDQWLVFAGGPWSAPGYSYGSFSARAMLSQRLEFRFPVAAPSISLGKYGKSPGHITVAPFAQLLAVTGNRDAFAVNSDTVPLAEQRKRVDGVYPSVGVGVFLFYDLIRADVSKGVRNGEWRFSIDIDRSFWGVL